MVMYKMSQDVHLNTTKFVKFVLKLVKVDNCNLIYGELHFKIYYFC